MAAPKSDFGAWFAAQGAGGAAVVPQGGAAAGSASGAPLSGVAAAFGSFMPSAQAGGASVVAAASSAVAGARAGVSSVLLTMGVPGVSAATAKPDGAGDVEAGGGSGTPGGDGAPAPSPASTSETASFLPAGLARLNPLAAVGLGGGAPAPPEWTCGLSTAQRFQMALLLLGGSAVLFSLSIFMFLPVVILLPSKFATSFTFASLMFMGGLAMLRGPRATLTGFLHRERAPFAAAYVGSIGLTLYATLGAQSYLLVLAAVCMQFAALAWYAASAIPGGTTGMGLLSRYTLSAFGAGARGVGALSRGVVMGR